MASWRAVHACVRSETIQVLLATSCSISHDEADTDAADDDEELRRQLAGQRNVMVLALREALGRSGREAEAHRREAEAHRREAEAQRQEIEAHRRDAEAHRREAEAQRRQTERLRREVARLQAEDGHCARSRPYYWQR